MAERARGGVQAIGLFCLLATVIALAWLRLFDLKPPISDVLLLVGAAALPMLALLVLRGRWALVVVPGVVALAVLLAAAEAFGVPVTEMRPGGEHDFFGPVLEAAREGMRDTFRTEVPVDRFSHPGIESLALFAIFAFSAACGLLLARRRLLLAGMVLVGAVGWPSTPVAVAGGNSLGVGALLLAALLLLLFVAGPGRRRLRGSAQAIALAAIVGLAAVGAATSSAVTKDSLVDFRQWNPYEQPRAQVGVRYVWSTSYAPLSWPDEPTVVLRIEAPERALYWRATTLDRYDGIGWTEALTPSRRAGRTRVVAGRDPFVTPRALDDRASWTRQEVTVAGLADDHLVGAAQPVQWTVPPGTETRIATSGAIVVPDGLEPGSTYTVTSYTPRPLPRDLVELGADYPARLEPYLEVLPGVHAPEFDERRRSDEMERLFREGGDDTLLAQFQPIYEQARAAVGDASSPYVAAVGLERWLRETGGFEYDETPPDPGGDMVPLVDFVLNGKRGYCQHYAGAMALMLRLLGVPARVAAGFISGEYDDATGTWIVTDRDAHTWVEAWFPDYGWLPFDPTPGRGRLAEPYSSSSEGFSLTEEEQGGGVDVASIFAQQEKLAEIFAEQLEALQGLGGAAPSTGADAPGAPPAVGASEGSGGGGGGGLPLPVLVVIAVAGAAALYLASKHLLRRSRFWTSDPRARAGACRRELVGFLADQGLELPASLTLAELGGRLGRLFGVETTRFVRAASEARFGTPERAEAAAAEAERELGALIGGIRRNLRVRRRIAGAFRLRSLTA